MKPRLAGPLGAGPRSQAGGQRRWRHGQASHTARTQCVVAIILTTGMELTFEDKIIILEILSLIGPSLSRHAVP